MTWTGPSSDGFCTHQIMENVILWLNESCCHHSSLQATNLVGVLHHRHQPGRHHTGGSGRRRSSLTAGSTTGRGNDTGSSSGTGSSREGGGGRGCELRLRQSQEEGKERDGSEAG